MNKAEKERKKRKVIILECEEEREGDQEGGQEEKATEIGDGTLFSYFLLV